MPECDYIIFAGCTDFEKKGGKYNQLASLFLFLCILLFRFLLLFLDSGLSSSGLLSIFNIFSGFAFYLHLLLLLLQLVQSASECLTKDLYEQKTCQNLPGGIYCCVMNYLGLMLFNNLLKSRHPCLRKPILLVKEIREQNFPCNVLV